jgi:DNA-binding transcriptional regulator PaaX
VTEFLRHVGGYSEAEIAAMQDTHAWSMRLAAAPTVPRELRAEHAFALDSLGLGRLRTSCLMVLGSQSPAWAQRSTDAYAAALADVRVERLEGHGHGGVVSASELVSRLVADFGLG